MAHSSSNTKPLQFVLEKNHNSAETEIFFKTFNAPVATMPQISPISKWTCASCWLFLSLPKEATPSSQNPQHVKQAWDKLWANPLRFLHKESAPFVKKALEQWIPNPQDGGLSERQVEEMLIALAKDHHFAKVVNEIMPIWLKEHPQSPLLKKLPPHALQKASQMSQDALKAYQTQKTKTEGMLQHKELLNIFIDFHRQFFLKGYRGINKQDLPQKFLPPSFTTTAPFNEVLIQKMFRSLSEQLHLVGPALILLPLPFLKELKLPYTLLFNGGLKTDKGALPFLNPEMFDPSEQQKLISYLTVEKTLVGFDEKNAPYYEALLEYGVENHISLLGIKTLPPYFSITPPLSTSPSLHHGIASVLQNIAHGTRSPILTKAKPFLRRVDKHCGMDPYLKGLLKFYYDSNNIQFPLEGSSLLPNVPKNGNRVMPTLKDAYQKALKQQELEKQHQRLERATNKSKSKKSKTLSRKM